MNFADLQVFKTVVDEGGVIKAANKLHRVPSAVTMRIKQLEASIGVKLFHRDRQRLHLSPAGELLRDYAERLIQLSDEARDVVSGTSPRGVLKLGALESTTASRLPPILAGYHIRYPDVRLELVTGTNDVLLGQLAERKLDAAFMAEPPADRGFEHLPVFSERLTVISSPDHPPIKRARDVEGDSLIAFPEGCAYRRVLQRWLGRDSLAPFRVLDLSSYHAIVACVTAGAGIALVPESVLDTMPHAAVRRHPLPKAQSLVTTPLVWRRGEISPSVLALRTLVASLPKQTNAAEAAEMQAAGPKGPAATKLKSVALRADQFGQQRRPSGPM